MSSLKDKTIKGVFWSAVERFSAQGIHFLFNIFIARILSPSDFGVIAMINVFLNLSQTFIDCGFGVAIIRKVDRTENDLSTVYIFNVVTSLLFYGVFWILSPHIAHFYNLPDLLSITRVISITLVISSFAGVHYSLLSINVDFKARAKISIISSVLAGSLCLFLAYHGYGYWALVAQSVLACLVKTALVIYHVKWKPRFLFSWASFKYLFSFGGRLLLSGLVDTIYNNLYTLVIGKKFTASSLGEFTKAETYAKFPASNLTGALQAVVLPILSDVQNDEKILVNYFSRFISLSIYLIFPVMLVLVSIAEPLVDVVLTSRWAGIVPLFRLLCLDLMLYPVHALNMSLLQVKGRSDLYLRSEIIKKVVGLLVLIMSIPHGIYYMCIGKVISSILYLIPNILFTSRIVDFGFIKQLRIIVPQLLLSVSMAVVVYIIISFINTPCMQVLLGLVVGGLYYVGVSYFFGIEDINELASLLKIIIKR